MHKELKGIVTAGQLPYISGITIGLISGVPHIRPNLNGNLPLFR